MILYHCRFESGRWRRLPPHSTRAASSSPGANGVGRSPRAVSLAHSASRTGLGAFLGVPLDTSVIPSLRRFAWCRERLRAGGTAGEPSTRRRGIFFATAPRLSGTCSSSRSRGSAPPSSRASQHTIEPSTPCLLLDSVRCALVCGR